MINLGILESSGGAAGGIVVTDPDAQAFIDITEISTQGIANALDNLIIGFKADGDYSYINVMYPFISDGINKTREFQHSFNVKDPRDLDAAHRITWHGATPHTHSANGIQPDGATSYADTHMLEADFGTVNSLHACIYSRTDGQDSDITVEYGAHNGTTQSNMRLFSGGNRIWVRFGATSAFKTNTTGLGCFIASRVGASEIYGWINGVRTTNFGTTTLGLVTGQTYYISAVQNAPGTSDWWSDRELAFACFGTLLIDARAIRITNRINTFQTALGRDV